MTPNLLSLKLQKAARTAKPVRLRRPDLPDPTLVRHVVRYACVQTINWHQEQCH